jgi:dTDP-glucose 4,6-dehydratase
VADATLKLTTEGEVGEVYHIATQSTISIKGLVQLICDEMETKFEEVVDIVDDRSGKDAAYLLDSTKIREALGWRDVVTLEQGIDEVRVWIDANLSKLEQQVDHYIHKP